MKCNMLNTKAFIKPENLFVIAIFFLLLSYSLSGHSVAQMNLHTGPDKGDTAPDFTLSDLNGTKHTLSDYRGRVVLLNFWAKWCAPCVSEMPSMESLHEKLKGEKFIILAVSVDKGDTSSIKKFVEKKHFSFPVLHSPDGLVQKRYKAGAIPTTFVIDKNGTIYSRILGAQKWDCPEALKHLRGALDM